MTNRFLAAAFLGFCFCSSFEGLALAQGQPQTVQPPIATTTATPSPSPTPVGTPRPSLEKHFVGNIFHDQYIIWTSPFRIHSHDLKWIAPLGLTTAALFATDRYTSGWVDRTGSLPFASKTVSRFGEPYATVGVAGAFYFGGMLTHNERARETGILSVESLIDTGIVTEVLKVAARRERPNEGTGQGRFFQGGTSFPSGHSSSIWSLATVIAYEYHDKPLVAIVAYGSAVAVSMSRFSGRNHFLSDIVVGSAIGFGIGRYVYKTRHVEISNSTTDTTTTHITKLMPIIVPYYSPRTRTYGGSLSWSF